MEGTRVTKSVTNQRVGNTVVQQQDVVAAKTVDSETFWRAKVNQFLWYIGHFIAILLGLRFIFLMLGANLRGIVLFIYDLSGIFVLPFRGIFPSPQAGESYFDTAALLGIAMYYLLILLITKTLELFSRQTEA